jgi:hypothetical protein
MRSNVILVEIAFILSSRISPDDMMFARVSVRSGKKLIKVLRYFIRARNHHFLVDPLFLNTLLGKILGFKKGIQDGLVNWISRLIPKRSDKIYCQRRIFR